MLQFYAHRFLTVMDLLKQLEQMPMHQGKPAVANLSAPGVAIIVERCDDLIGQLRGIGLKLSCKSIERIKHRIELEKWVDPTIGDQLAEARKRIHDELEDVFLFSIAPERISMWSPSAPLFGAAVEAKFPAIAEDVSEAAKCVAVGRYTAAVFHLMRVMELLVQHLGTALGVQLTVNKNWQAILDEVNKKLKALPKSDKTTSFAALATHLYGVKVAWRNEVMHPKATYTEEEAANIYSHVKSFAGEMARIS